MVALRSGAVAVLGLVLLAGAVQAAPDDQKGKDQPEYGSGEKLKRYIQARGWWDKQGFHITAIKRGGPATKLRREPGAEPSGYLEPGDAIVEVAGTRIESQVDYAGAMNGAKDPNNIAIKVRDRNSGKVYTWYIGSKSSPFEN
jgi:hypothetical protein